MKTMTLLFVLIIFMANAYSQIGKLSYYEGTVKIVKQGVPQKAKLNQSLFEGDMIQTGKESVAEIEWTNGKKTCIGASSQQDVNVLFASSGSSIKSTGVLGNFGSILDKGVRSNKETQTGGVRRDLFGNSAVTFEEAKSFYDAGEYLKALNKFSDIYENNADQPEAKFILFAKGHCLIMLNNFVEAKQVFTEFVAKYPDSELTSDAKKILDDLK